MAADILMLIIDFTTYPPRFLWTAYSFCSLAVKRILLHILSPLVCVAP